MFVYTSACAYVCVPVCKCTHVGPKEPDYSTRVVWWCRKAHDFVSRSTPLIISVSKLRSASPFGRTVNRNRRVLRSPYYCPGQIDHFDPKTRRTPVARQRRSVTSTSVQVTWQRETVHCYEAISHLDRVGLRQSGKLFVGNVGRRSGAIFARRRYTGAESSTGGGGSTSPNARRIFVLLLSD